MLIGFFVKTLGKSTFFRLYYDAVINMCVIFPSVLVDNTASIADNNNNSVIC